MESQRIIEGDALETLAGLEGPFDVVLMDPPYCSGSVGEAQRTAATCQGRRSDGCGSRFGWFVGDNMGTAGLAFLLRHVALAARSVLAPSGHLLCFTDWRQVPNLAPAIESSGLRFQNLVVWSKPMGLGLGFRASHELVMHFTAGSPEYHDKGTGNVITCGRSRSEHHPTQKPVEVLERLLRVTCPPGGRVLDPFAGSGSTGIACQRLGLSFVGIERDGGLVEVARKRLEPVGLFDEV